MHFKDSRFNYENRELQSNRAAGQAALIQEAGLDPYQRGV